MPAVINKYTGQVVDQESQEGIDSFLAEISDPRDWDDVEAAPL